MDSTLLAARLKALRIKHGLTQQELGNYLNITQQGYFYYESGKRTPDLTTLTRLADLYNLTLNELLSSCNTQAASADKVAESTPYIESSCNETIELLPYREKTLLRLFSELSANEKEDFMELLDVKLRQAQQRKKKE